MFGLYDGRPLNEFGCRLAIVPVFSWIAEGSVAHIAEGLVIISVLIAIICAPLNAYMVSLFPQSIP